MTREEKAVIIDQLAQTFAEYPTFYITNVEGMTVAQVNQLRKLCYTKGIGYKVIKNTLIKKALEKNNVDHAPLAKALEGSSGVMFATVGNAPAKLLKEFYKTSKNKPAFKGASVASDFYVGEKAFDSLVNLKSKEEMIGEIIGMLQSPAQRVISALVRSKEGSAE